jgi:hypothetical protein
MRACSCNWIECFGNQTDHSRPTSQGLSKLVPAYGGTLRVTRRSRKSGGGFGWEVVLDSQTLDKPRGHHGVRGRETQRLCNAMLTVHRL